MSDFVGTAKRLRMVRQAQRSFLKMWALQEMSARPATLDRVAHEIEQLSDAAAAEHALGDPFNHDWALLYRGDVLDD